MRKSIATIFCAILLCSLLLITLGPSIGTAQDVYERFSCSTQVIPTIDGNWTSEDEWTDGQGTWIGTDVAFTSTWDMADDVLTRWIVEFFSDTTDDSEDYWQFCIDGDQSGGSSPQPSDYKFEIKGHTTLEWYTGGVNEWTGPVSLDESEIEWASSFSASPTNSTPHWILEFQIGKNTGTVQMGILWNFRVAAFDASNTEAGVLAWPPTSDPDVPDSWGIENYTSEPPTEPIPEGLTFGVMALLSSVSVIVSYKHFVKRKKKKVAA